MLVGRVLYGLGGENLTVASSALLARWFMGGDLAFASALVLSSSRLGSVVNNKLSPWFAREGGSCSTASDEQCGNACFASWAASILLLLSFIFALMLYYIDSRFYVSPDTPDASEGENNDGDPLLSPDMLNTMVQPVGSGTEVDVPFLGSYGGDTTETEKEYAGRRAATLAWKKSRHESRSRSRSRALSDDSDDGSGDQVQLSDILTF